MSIYFLMGITNDASVVIVPTEPNKGNPMLVTPGKMMMRG